MMQRLVPKGGGTGQVRLRDLCERGVQDGLAPA